MVDGSPSFVLYRILGNDLPPRHQRGQTLNSLRFILANEQPLLHCEKRWVLNRIADPKVETALLEAIAGAGQTALRIPFSLEEYTRCPVMSDGLREEQYLHSRAFRSSDPVVQRMVTEFCLRERNRYAINNNGARNVALQDGLERARWVLPWDGNLFMTERAWAGIVAAAAAAGDVRYLIVPMLRALEAPHHPDTLDGTNATEEPQIAFRNDATERFDERLRYGESPKAALLVRLGVEGRWLNWPKAVAGARLGGPFPASGQWCRAGWVVRLASGNKHADREGVLRHHARRASVVGFLRSLADRAVSETLASDPCILFGELEIRWLRTQAEHARLLESMFRVMPAELESRTGFTDVRSVVRRLATAALFGCINRDRTSLTMAAGLTRALLADSAAFAPAGVDAISATSTEAAPDGAVMSRFRHLLPVLDAVRILRRADALTDKDVDTAQGLSLSVLDRLTGAAGEEALTSFNSTGTWYDLVTLALAVFVRNASVVREVLERAPMRIAQQFRSDGSQPHEESRDRPMQSSLSNLEAWTQLARALRPFAFDAWNFSVNDGRSLQRALQRLTRASAELSDGARSRLEAVTYLSPWRTGITPGAHWIAAIDADADSGLSPLWWSTSPLSLDNGHGAAVPSLDDDVRR